MEAATVYFLAYNEDLPLQEYTVGDLEYIIEQCNRKLIHPEVDFLNSETIH